MSHTDREYEEGTSYRQEPHAAAPEPFLSRRLLLWISGGLAATLLILCACMLMGGAFYLGRQSAQSAQPAAPEAVPSGEPTAAAGQLPQAVITAAVEAQAGQPVEFDGSGSQAGDVPITRYEWQFGDGATGEGAQVSHAYAAAGSYPVVLTVTDEQGQSNSSAPHQIVVSEGAAAPPPAAPVINAFVVSPIQIATGECVDITWDVSVDAVRVVLLRDGTPSVENGGLVGQLSDCPEQAGSSVYRLEVYSADGQSASQEQAVTIVAGEPPPPQNPLAGTSWQVRTLQGGQAPLPGTAMTLLFGPDGTISGNGGCNNYTGAYTANGNTLSITSVSTPGGLCGAEIDTQEQTYLSLLGSVAAFQTSGTQLSLADGTGNEVLRLETGGQ